MTIEIDESSAKITKRGVIVWVNNGNSMHSITISRTSWKFLLKETKGVHPQQIMLNQLIKSI